MFIEAGWLEMMFWGLFGDWGCSFLNVDKCGFGRGVNLLGFSVLVAAIDLE